MRDENILTNIVQVIEIDSDIEREVREQLVGLKKIHSMIVYGIYNNDVLEGWDVHYNISQTNKFNTITVSEIVNKLKEALVDDGTVRHVYTHLQPTVSILIRQYRWLIVKLCKEMHAHWEFLEMEDLIQMCNLVICDLYNKNYYIHKRLIRRSFTNYVLMHIRKNKNRPAICSLEQLYHKSDSDSDVTFAEMIPDKQAMYAEEDKYDDEVLKQIIGEVRDIVVDLIGKRQYDQLLREYGNKQTTPWSRKLMVKIKAHLYDMGITSKSFNKYYG